jgi:transporter family-2 protein
MKPVILVPVVLGVVAVVQATLNRQVADRWGLAPAVLLNTILASVCSLAFLGYCAALTPRAGMLRVSFDLSDFRVWWLLPGLFGFGIVAGLPWAVGKAGALATFVALVAAQMVASALWDRFVDGSPLTASRVLGAVLAVVSVLLAGRR